MGAYFSLRGAAEWERAVSETLEPSIWSNVSFTPLSRSQKMLLRRGHEVQFTFPAGINQGGDIISISDVADLSLIVGLHESVGRFYSGLLVHAPLPEQPHTYSRAVEEVLLSGQSTTTGPRPTASSRPAAKDAPGAPTGEPFTGSALSQLDSEDPPATQTDWPYLLLYAVKEGVLAFFAADYESCEEVIREIAGSYSDLPADGSPTKEGQSQVHCVHCPMGRAPPPVGRVAHELLAAELKRDFAIRCEVQEQASSTNCVVFCLRMMIGFKLSVRGYEIASICDDRPGLGPLPGKAAGDAWEQLWRRVRT